MSAAGESSNPLTRHDASRQANPMLKQTLYSDMNTVVPQVRNVVQAWRSGESTI